VCSKKEEAEIKEKRDSGTTISTTVSIESKYTWTFHHMLALGKFSLLVAIQSRCSGGRPY
jgi:hypothetical protein